VALLPVPLGSTPGWQQRRFRMRSAPEAPAGPSALAFPRRRWPDGRRRVARRAGAARADVVWRGPGKPALVQRPSAPPECWRTRERWLDVPWRPPRRALGPCAVAPRARRHGQRGCQASHLRTWAGASAGRTLRISRRSRRLKPHVTARQTHPGLGAPPEGREGAGYDTTGSRRQTPTAALDVLAAPRAPRCCRGRFAPGPPSLSAQRRRSRPKTPDTSETPSAGVRAR
jgi:hypothetical protein